jgi:hypothetical protein
VQALQDQAAAFKERITLCATRLKCAAVRSGGVATAITCKEGRGDTCSTASALDGVHLLNTAVGARYLDRSSGAEPRAAPWCWDELDRRHLHVLRRRCSGPNKLDLACCATSE